jgi:hypothetical protein
MSRRQLLEMPGMCMQAEDRRVRVFCFESFGSASFPCPLLCAARAEIAANPLKERVADVCVAKVFVNGFDFKQFSSVMSQVGAATALVVQQVHWHPRHQ